MLSVVKKLREPVNGLTHLAGAVLAAGALVWLLWIALGAGRPWQAVAFGVFGLSMVGLYLASALYHLMPLPRHGVPFWRRLDHMMIYVLIAGTYTPICAAALHGAWRWGMLALIWGLAIAGVIYKAVWHGAAGWPSLVLYMGMGWVAIIALPQIWRVLPTGAIAWIVAGGLIYTAGALVLGLKRPDPIPGVFGFHELWHLFVLGGSACFFWVVVRYIAPLG